MHLKSLTTWLHASRVRVAIACAGLLTAAALGGCSTSPPVHFHSLVPVGTPARAASANAATGSSIILEPVRVPAQVDQPQWLIRLPDDSVARLEQERWASPLRDELRLALLEWLVDRHGMTEARGSSTGSPPIRIAVDVRRFESVPGREAWIEGTWTLTRTLPGAEGTSTSCDWLVREPAEAGYTALATAQRRVVERLADDVAGGLSRFSSGQAQVCPPRRTPIAQSETVRVESRSRS